MNAQGLIDTAFLSGGQSGNLASARLNAMNTRFRSRRPWVAGVEAGRAGGFCFVIGIDRTGQAAELRARRADVVVTSLADLLEAP